MAVASLDPTFNPTIEMSGISESVPAGIYSTRALSDGRILIGGRFSSVNGVDRRHLAILKADGSLDGAFNPPPVSHFGFFEGESTLTAVYGVAQQADGKTLLGGYFNNLDGTSRGNFARLKPDGSLDSDFQADFDSVVYAIAVQPDGKILVGGKFTTANGTIARRLTRLNADGTVDPSFKFGGANGTVFSIALQTDGKILIGGEFSSLNLGAAQEPLLARLNADGSVDTGFHLGAPPFQLSLAPKIFSIAPQPDGKIFIAGDFGIFGADRLNLAKLNADGSLESGFRPAGTGGPINSLAVQADGKVVVGGQFFLANNVFQSELARFKSDGSIDRSLLNGGSGANGPVENVVLQPDGGILLAGHFSLMNGQPRTFLARLLPAQKLVPSVTLEPSSITNDFSGRVLLKTTGLDWDQELTLETFLDENGNGAIDQGEPLVQFAALKDGAFPNINGARNLNQVGDDDGAINGELTVAFDLARRTEIDAIAGRYLYRLSGPNFDPVVRGFSILPKTYPQSVVGKVTAAEDHSAVAGALAVLFELNGGQLATSSFTDASGNFQLFAPPGPYLTLALRRTYVTELSAAQGAELPIRLLASSQTVTQNFSLIRPPRLISATVLDEETGRPLPAAEIFAVSEPTNEVIQFTFGITDAAGKVQMPVSSGQWSFMLQEKLLARLGYLTRSSFPPVDTSTGAVAQVSLSLPPANALIYGKLQTPDGAPVIGMPIQAQDSSIDLSTSTTSDSTGRFALGVRGGNWNVRFVSEILDARNYEAEGADLSVTANQALEHNFILKPIPVGLTVTGFSPAAAPVGTVVTVKGTNFTHVTKVEFNGVDAPFNVSSDTELLATVMDGSTTGLIRVSSPKAEAFSAAPFTVTPTPPRILTQPLSQTVTAGSTVNFSVAAFGAEPLVYQWNFQSKPIPGATNTTLSLTNVTSGNGGPYFVTVKNVAGTNQSDTAFLTVKLPPGPGEFVWASRAGGIGADSGSAIAADAAGNSYVIGSFAGSAIFEKTTLTSRGGQDLLIAKLDSNGNLVWVKQAGGVGDDLGYGIALDAAGNVYVTGATAAAAQFESVVLPGSNAGPTLFLAKYDSAGKFLWVRSAPSTGESQGYGVAVSATGKVFVTGEFKASVQFGSQKLDSRGGADIFLAQYDSDGNVGWVRQAGGTDDDFGYAVAVDSSGNPGVAGEFGGKAQFGTIQLTSAGDTDIFLVKYNPNGDLLWAERLGGSGSDAGLGLAVDSLGQWRLAGQFSDSFKIGDDLLASRGGLDILMANFDSAGQPLWAKGAGGPEDDTGYAVAIDTNGNSYFTGYFQQSAKFGGLNLTGSAGFDLFVAKLFRDGNISWAKAAGSSGDDYGYGIAVDGSGNVRITGEFGLNVSFGDQLAISLGNQDLFVAGIVADLAAPALLAPSILVQPENQAATVGADVVLSVSAQGTAPLTYQWFFNGLELPGETSAVLNIFKIQAVQAGSYSVKIKNAVGTVESRLASVTISAHPVFSRFSPNQGAAGTKVMISGSGLNSVIAVEFNGKSAEFVLNNNGELLAAAPADVTSGAITLRTATAAVTSPENFTVTSSANQPPQIKLGSPLEGQVFAAPADVRISATASDADGSIMRVEFYSGGVLLYGIDTPLVGTISTSFTWHDVPPGSHSIQALAIDQNGAVAICPALTITVTGTISSPRLGLQHSGQNLVLEWDGAGYVLESTTDLNSASVWAPVLQLPSSIGGKSSVVDAIGGPRRFYRLRKL